MEGQERSTPRLIADAFGLYRRYPLLFLILAAAVIVPFELLELAWRGTEGTDRSAGNAAIGLGLGLFYLVVVGPLVSALHIHAVADVRAGEEPRLLSIAKRGLGVLPVVCAAAIMAWLGIFGGFLLFVVPGFVLWIRWLVVAQVAAIERQGWTAALRRSWALTEGSSLHVFVFSVCTGVVLFAPGLLLNLALKGSATAVVFPADVALEVVLVSFTALATALLYYDLRGRRERLAAALPDTADSGPPSVPPVDHGLDPRDYSDEERPNGWYVDPQSPHRMRYWIGGDQPAWHGKARTPGELRRRFDEEEEARIAERLGRG